jgi:hypothetical protein
MSGDLAVAGPGIEIAADVEVPRRAGAGRGARRCPPAPVRHEWRDILPGEDLRRLDDLRTPEGRVGAEKVDVTLVLRHGAGQAGAERGAVRAEVTRAGFDGRGHGYSLMTAEASWSHGTSTLSASSPASGTVTLIAQTSDTAAEPELWMKKFGAEEPESHGCRQESP